MDATALQTLIALLIVAGCSAYAAWTLMPSRWRGALQRRLTGRAPAPASGCGACGGCAGKPARPAASPGSKVVTLHRRLPQAGQPPPG